MTVRRALLITALLVLLLPAQARAGTLIDRAVAGLQTDNVYVDPDADWAHLPDPIADAVKSLSARVAELERRLAAADGTPPPAEVVPLRHRRGPNPAGG